MHVQGRGWRVRAALAWVRRTGGARLRGVPGDAADWGVSAGDGASGLPGCMQVEERRTGKAGAYEHRRLQEGCCFGDDGWMVPGVV